MHPQVKAPSSRRNSAISDTVIHVANQPRRPSSLLKWVKGVAPLRTVLKSSSPLRIASSKWEQLFKSQKSSDDTDRSEQDSSRVVAKSPRNASHVIFDIVEEVSFTAAETDSSATRREYTDPAANSGKTSSSDSSSVPQSQHRAAATIINVTPRT